MKTATIITDTAIKSQLLIRNATLLITCLLLNGISAGKDLRISPDLDRSPGPATVVNCYIYDSEGNYGVAYASRGSFKRPGMFTSVWGLEDGTTGTTDDGNLDPFGTNLPAIDLPFWWESTNPFTGTWRGWGTTKTSYNFAQPYVFPLPGSKIGMSFWTLTDSGNRFSVLVDTSLADSLTRVAPIAAYYMPGPSGKSSILSAIYLPGNVNYETVGAEHHIFGPADPTDAGFVAATWGNYQPPLSPHNADFSHTIPQGPFLLVVAYDQTTASVFPLEGLVGKYNIVHSLCMALPGSDLPSARELVTREAPPEWLLRSSLERTLTSHVRLATDLVYYCDKNQDGILDAGDFIDE